MSKQEVIERDVLDDAILGLSERACELHDHLVAMKDGVSIDGKPLSKGTINTQTFQKTRELNQIRLVRTLLEQLVEHDITVKLSLSQLETLKKMSTTLTSNKAKRASITVQKGDNAFQLLQSNPTYTFAKIQKAATAAGLTISGTGDIQ